MKQRSIEFFWDNKFTLAKVLAQYLNYAGNILPFVIIKLVYQYIYL